MFVLFNILNQVKFKYFFLRFDNYIYDSLFEPKEKRKYSLFKFHHFYQCLITFSYLNYITKEA